MFELQVLLSNLVAPSIVVLFGWLVCRSLPRDRALRVLPYVLTACSGLAIWLALAVRNGFSWWPEDAWQKVPIAALIVAGAAVIDELFRAKPYVESAVVPTGASSRPTNLSLSAISQLIAIALAVALAAWLIFPRGDAWAELQSQQNQWCTVVTLAASFAWWGVAGCQPRVAATVGLATIPLLIASAFLTSLSLMKVTEPLIAVASVLGCCSLIDLRLSGRRSLPIMIAPSLFAMSGFVAHASFQSYLNLPRTLYFLAMLSPAIVALAARVSQRKSARLAIGVTVGLALVLAATVSVWTYVAGDVGAEAEW